MSVELSKNDNGLDHVALFGNKRGFNGATSFQKWIGLGPVASQQLIRFLTHSILLAGWPWPIRGPAVPDISDDRDATFLRVWLHQQLDQW